jgi:hypothetical protein
MSGDYCATQTVLGCLSPEACTNVLVRPRPVIGSVNGSNPTTCGGTNGTITLGGLTAGQTYSVSYTRNGSPQGPLSLVANGSGQVIITGLNQASYANFTVTLNGCLSGAFAGPEVLSDPPTPSAPVVSSNSPICETETLNLFATGQGGATYSWTGPGGYNSSTQNPTRPNALPGMSGSYCATQTVANCLSQEACVTVTVRPKPVITNVTGSSPTTCGGSNGSITISGLLPSTNYSLSYTFNAAPQGPTTISSTAGGQDCNNFFKRRKLR